MTQTKTEPKLYSFDEFINWYPENANIRYELHNGVILEMPKPKGKHSHLTGCLIEQLLMIVRQVVSSNWRDDYYNKFRDYEEMGIQEYWIVDYAALGPRKLIGNPKQPTFFVCYLIDGEYQMTAFTGNTSIVSPTFSLFNLSAHQIFNLTF